MSFGSIAIPVLLFFYSGEHSLHNLVYTLFDGCEQRLVSADYLRRRHEFANFADRRRSLRRGRPLLPEKGGVILGAVGLFLCAGGAPLGFRRFGVDAGDAGEQNRPSVRKLRNESQGTAGGLDIAAQR
jgi:hypothetical protein